VTLPPEHYDALESPAEYSKLRALARLPRVSTRREPLVSISWKTFEDRAGAKPWGHDTERLVSREFEAPDHEAVGLAREILPHVSSLEVRSLIGGKKRVRYIRSDVQVGWTTLVRPGHTPCFANDALVIDEDDVLAAASRCADEVASNSVNSPLVARRESDGRIGVFRRVADVRGL